MESKTKLAGIATGVGLIGSLYLATRSGLPCPEEFSVVLPETANPEAGEGAIHRHPSAKDGLAHRPETGEATLYETFQRGVRLSGGRPCLGRKAGFGFEWESYSQINVRMAAFGSGLRNLDLVPFVEGTAQTAPFFRMLAIFCKNCVEWVIAEQACFSQSVTTVPLYDTLGADSIETVIQETLLTTILCTAAEAKRGVECKASCTTLQNLILIDTIRPDLRTLAAQAGLNLYTFSQVEASGEQHPQPPNPPKPDTIATFCYTSGTTGKPKGALLSHKGLVADMVGAEGQGVVLTPQDRHLSYLPLAHAFERLIQAIVFHCGAQVGFYQGDTSKLPEDIHALRPTVFPSVPRLLNRFYDKIMSQIQARGGAQAKLFWLAYTCKRHGLGRGWLTHSVWDRLVFRTVAQQVGLDHCRLMITGSAPIASHVLDFFRIVFSCRVIEGYGQTETCAAATVTHMNDFSTGHVGGPLSCNEIRLVSVPDMGYLVTNTTHGQGPSALVCRGRGEVCFRGPNMFRGYYKSDGPPGTVNTDGWVLSGDIGLWTLRGQLKIIDRKKNIFKLAQGEYIAPEKIENVYAKSLYVAQSFVYGDSYQAQLVAIVHPERLEVLRWALKHGKEGSFETLCGDEEVVRMIHGDMDKIRQAARLFGFEHAARIWLDPLPLNPERGLLTPTFKLRRDVAKTVYQPQIDAMYEALGGVAGVHGIKQGVH
eukprot:NODE_446_length_2227_cov_20.143810_g414_i0.p1 GENE.NODE_446_length_2227_cov_20.143810_g414_i0~~NODE_446_length_2227_cov_20.143810_g414_i0.p1  ORF type:complete len:707 (+),score=132.48 NODE_446_length_2227_cov_20.143810_g414_i0:63-2183(+)